MVAVRNISDGPRGAWNGAVLVMADPGEVIEADDFSEEWFEPDEGAEGKPRRGRKPKAEAEAGDEPDEGAEGEVDE